MPEMPITEINQLLRERMQNLVIALTGESRCASRNGEVRLRRRGSLAVVVSGTKRGQWFDHEAGAGGDPLGLVAHLMNCSIRDACRWAANWLGRSGARPSDVGGSVCMLDQPAGPRSAVSSTKAWSDDKAVKLWESACSPAGTPAEEYLRSRGLFLPDEAPVRFSPRAWRNSGNGPPGPAMIALLTAPETNEPTGILLTYLRHDGSGKADGPGQKVILGRTGVIRLVPDELVTTGLGLTEGLETALAVMQRIGWRPVWAASSAGRIARFPVLAGIEALTLFADSDEVGLKAAHTCATRWAEAGREVRIIRPPCGDWDDRTWIPA